MSKTRKQKVIDFLSFLKDNRLTTSRNEDGDIVHRPTAGTCLHYKDREVIEISEYTDHGAHNGAMVIALFLEETITPSTLKHFEAFKKFRLPK